MKVGDSSELEISSSSSPSKMAVTSAAPPPPPEAVAHHEGGGGEVIEMEVDGKGSSELGDKMNINFGGNRWPRQETLALLKIRSDMDAVFRDSSLKGPLWEEVSRKLANLGYQRSAKKCKEKFENVYKYHKRTKDSRSGKSEGKNYKFSDQLQALETHQFTLVSYPQKPQPPVLGAATTTTRPGDTSTSHVTTFPSTNPTTTTLISPSQLTNPTTTTQITNPKQNSYNNNNNSLPNMNHLFSAISSTTSNSSSTASDEDLEEEKRYKKRKWKKDYFKRLTREVLAKQEEMQKKFLEAMDKRERERAAQQDAWRMQEISRINREHEILVQERSTAATKDGTVIALLQKLSGQQILTQQQPPPQQISQIQSPQQPTQLLPQPLPQPQPVVPKNNNLEIQKIMSNGDNHAIIDTPMLNSSSRWPKAEVHALIRIRTSIESNNYHEINGPKAAMWEDISAAMKRLGYNRSSKRCKEKWENINKYFKKVKESNKQRRPDSKTCPYFDELDAIYREKSKNSSLIQNNMKPNNNEMMEPLMVQPEQQWRPPTHEEGMAKQNTGHNRYQQKEEEQELEDELDDVESVEDEGAGHYESETNNKLVSSMDSVE